MMFMEKYRKETDLYYFGVILTEGLLEAYINGIVFGQ